MSDIAPIGRPGAAALGRSGHTARLASSPTGPARGRDQVELSNTAQLLSKLGKLPDVRHDVVDRVRAQIAAGGYETPEKLDIAVDGLLDDLV